MAAVCRLRGFAVQSWAHRATGLMQWWEVAVHVVQSLLLGSGAMLLWAFPCTAGTKHVSTRIRLQAFESSS